jgi:uncharacterized protein (DUF433 family)
MSKAPDRTPWDGIIVTDPDVCFGKPRIAGTRLYVDFILASIEGGASLEDLVAEHPGLKRDQVKATIGFARDLVAGKRNRLKSEKQTISTVAPAEDHGELA